MSAPEGRANQRRRTRKDLIDAAARLAKSGRKLTLDEIAEEALVSRATAYRYFPTVDAVLLEAALDIAMPQMDELFAGAPESDPQKRVERVDDALDAMMRANEPQMRAMLAQSVSRAGADVPVRQNRRMPLIDAALAPARVQFKPKDYELMRKALAALIGVEGLVAFSDVLQLDEAEARKVRRWAIHALMDAARKPGA